MHLFPTITTRRLILRQFTLDDAPAIQRLAGAPEIAAGTFIPHPYEDGMAEQWITSQQADYKEGKLINFAVVLADEQSLIGSIAMKLYPSHRNGQLGYWIGVPYWGQGYCTEAAWAVLQFGFTQLDLQRVRAAHFKRNPASGRVMQKIGMQHEGCRRRHYLHRGQFEDAMLYGILRHEFDAG
jgi:[ribosomal protein S5]-alanine N-acetyltransferase